MSTPDYELMLERFYDDLLRRNDICVDVGAHVGRHTIPIARCVGDGGKVYAFEPIPSVFATLKAAVADAGLSAVVEPELCALSDESGEADFVLVHEAPGYSGLRTRHYDMPVTTESIRVHTRRLDEVFIRRVAPIRYIKIDCEGGELLVLRGARQLVEKDGPVVSFECGDNCLESYDYDSGDIYDFFNECRYDIQSITRVPMDRRGFIAATAKQEYWDYLAFPRAERTRTEA